MPQSVASIIFAVGILTLFYLDRDRNARVSHALWIPTAWLFVISSRPVSLWLGLAPLRRDDSAGQYVDGSPFDRNIFLFLLLLSLVVLLARSGRVGSVLRMNAVVLFYFLFCLASIVWSDFSFIAFRRWTKALGDIAMVLIILTELDPLAKLAALEEVLFDVYDFDPLIIINMFHLQSSETLKNLSEELIEEIKNLSRNSIGAIAKIFKEGIDAGLFIDQIGRAHV